MSAILLSLISAALCGAANPVRKAPDLPRSTTDAVNRAAAAAQKGAETPSPRERANEPSYPDVSQSNPSTSNEVRLERPHVRDARITQVLPKEPQPGDTIMVDVEVVPGRTVSVADLEHSLVILLDGRRLASMPSPDEMAEAPAADGSSPSEAGNSSAPSPAVDDGPTSLGVSLFARLPESLEPSQSYSISVYSTQDRRSVAAFGIVTAPRTLQSRLLYGFGVGVPLTALVAGGAVVWLRTQRRAEGRIRSLEKTLVVERSRLGGLLETAGNPARSAPSGAHTPAAPKVPEALVTALSQGEVTLVLGTGVAAEAGLPNFTTLWLNVLDRLAEGGDEASVQDLRQALVEQGPEMIVEPVVHRFERTRVLKAIVAELYTGAARPREFHEHIAALPVSSIIDMGWDRVLEERSLVARRPQVFSGARHRGITEALRAQRFTLIKPRGDIGAPEEIALTHQDYRRLVATSPELERAFASLYSTRTLLFLGMSLSGIEQFQAILPPQLGPSSQGHFALVPWSRNAELRAQDFASRFGITLLTFDGSENFEEVPRFLAKLLERVRTQSSATETQATPGVGALKSLTLQNIGNFAALELEFDPKWTLFLGDNGGGKSTILRAITLALAGNDERGEGMAARLLRTGQDVGSIALTMGAQTPIRLQTDLSRDGLRVRTTVPLDTPLQTGQALILGFPALRGVTTTQPAGPTRMDEPDPSVDDIAPLLLEKVDTRLNQLKQWVINTALQAESDPKSRAARMFATFRDVLRDTVPGRHVEFAGVDRNSWTVWLKTDDGQMSFDALSQGTSAILAWVGVLLQRLYGVYPHAEKPEECPAIVLIDEIDAHLHPRWQRRLVSLTRAKFPNVQVIATSHSPLLAGAMHRTELRLVERDPITGQMRAAAPREDIRGQKVDDILTSSLFALPSTRSPEAEALIRRYVSLFENYNRTPAEDEELLQLETDIDQLHYGPPAEKRERLEAVRNQMQAQVDAIPEDMAPALTALLSGSAVKGGDRMAGAEEKSSAPATVRQEEEAR